MNPSVGRIVHYRTRGSADGVYPPACFAAIVTNVRESGAADMVAFGPQGLRFELDVPQGDEIGAWHWPERVS